MILKDSWRVWPWPGWWALSVSWATLQSKQLFFSLHCLFRQSFVQCFVLLCFFETLKEWQDV
jgi:hypothetical protein